ncbi:MAG: outer membrane protein transport protein [Deltaproteobacteria bacterium]|nr:outer membrane protein transport protein [Deltaproteobacteria bacterium]
MTTLPLRSAALLLSALPSLAFGSGLTFGENGAKALSLGGAFAGQADDLSAIQHNPAGLTQQKKGFSFLLDASLMNQEVTFQKRNSADAAEGNAVSNSGGLFAVPFAAVGYGLEVAGRPFTVALGAYGPPAVGRYAFPEPNYALNESGRFVENPAKFAPQRYALVKNDTLLAFPGVSVAWQPHRAVSVGASLQTVYSSLKFEQYLTAAPELNDPKLDAKVGVNMSSFGGVTGILGVLVKPVETFQVGASFRPPVPVTANGTLDITLGDLIKDTAKVNGNKASLSLTLPMEVRVGTHWKPLPQLGVNVDVVYEGWQSFARLDIQPSGITQQLGSAEPEPLGTIRIPKNWRSSLSARAGVAYGFDFGLQLRAGALFEQQAMADKDFNIDFPNPQRFFVTGGASYPVGPVELVLSGAYTPTQTLVVTDSAVRQVTNKADVPGNVVGNGVYTSGGWIASLGIRGNFGPTPAN